MPSRLEEIQRTWNSLVPQAQQLNIARVRAWRQIPASIREGEERLNWLVAQITGRGVALNPVALTAPVALTNGQVTSLATDLNAFTFGVEIECFMPVGMTRHQLAQLITATGVRATAEEWNHTTRTYWKVITDGSLGDYTRGIEVVSPVLQGEAGFATLKTVSDCLVANGITIPRSATNHPCGLHVHLGHRTAGLEWYRSVLKLYSHFEDSIDTITSRSRRGTNNRWAQSTKLRLHQPSRAAAMERATTLAQLAIAYAGQLTYLSPPYSRRIDGWTPRQMEEHLDRYLKVNLASFWRHGTVEFRQHQGTIEFAKIEAWIKMLMRLALTAQNLPSDLGEDTLDNFAQVIALPAPELAYYKQRVVALTRVVTERR